jgi:hypothetical protein
LQWFIMSIEHLIESTIHEGVKLTIGSFKIGNLEVPMSQGEPHPLIVHSRGLRFMRVLNVEAMPRTALPSIIFCSWFYPMKFDILIAPGLIACDVQGHVAPLQALADHAVRSSLDTRASIEITGMCLPKDDDSARWGAVSLKRVTVHHSLWSASHTQTHKDGIVSARFEEIMVPTLCAWARFLRIDNETDIYFIPPMPRELAYCARGILLGFE